jgi:hypothetical protein
LYFHITPKKYLKSILKYGLVKGHSRGLTDPAPIPDYVFVIQDINYLVQCISGPDWISKEHPVVLAINCEDYEVSPYKDSPKEFVINRDIDPSHISIVGWLTVLDDKVIVVDDHGVHLSIMQNFS